MNRMTSELIPNLYGRNERFITLFETEAGCMAVIFVGALIVGSIQTTWMDHPIRSTAILAENQLNKMRFEKEAELVHEEHETIIFPKGVYALGIQEEFDILEGVRAVSD